MDIENSVKNLHRRFRYRPDDKVLYKLCSDRSIMLDDWRINMSPTGLVWGDCDDFAWALLASVSGYSWWRMIFYLLTFQAVLWHVRSYTGDGHLILWFRGRWGDNMEPDWYKTSELRHTRRFPWLGPLVLIKLLPAKFQRMG